jgi:hypothetical protein
MITYSLIETEKEEHFKVMVTNTVANPWAVMIHLEHTLFAD